MQAIARNAQAPLDMARQCVMGALDYNTQTTSDNTPTPELDSNTLAYIPVSYTHLRAHETVLDLVCRLLLEKKNKTTVHCRSASARLLPLPLSTPLPFFFF